VFGGQAQGIGKFLPGVNQGIPAALLCFVFLYIACKGAGPWSVDAKREAAKAGT
jgi:putative oxidoreductase